MLWTPWTQNVLPQLHRSSPDVRRNAVPRPLVEGGTVLQQRILYKQGYNTFNRRTAALSIFSQTWLYVTFGLCYGKSLCLSVCLSVVCDVIIIIIINRQFLTRRNMEPHHPLQGRELSMCREIQCCLDMSIVNYS